MINNVTLVGRLTKQPELKYTQNGTAIVQFTLAVNRSFKNKDGEYEADFIMCQAWRKLAEIIGGYGQKGMLVGVTGSIQTRNYENNEGRRVYITEINVDTFKMLESKNSNQQTNQPNNQPFDNQLDITDEDLPF